MWVTCAYGPYNFEFMTAVHKEIMARYRVDGIFLNRWDGNGVCYCKHCKENFGAATGLDLPRLTTSEDPARRAWAGWRQQRLMSLLDIWNGEIHKINPEACMVPNNGGGALESSGYKWETSRRAPMLVADRQARRACGSVVDGQDGQGVSVWTMGNKPVIGLFGVGLEEPYFWKDSVTSNEEIRIWVLDAIANGMRPWCSKFSATLHDERWLNGVEERSMDRKESALSYPSTASGSRRPGFFAADGVVLRRRARGEQSGGLRPGTNVDVSVRLTRRPKLLFSRSISIGPSEEVFLRRHTRRCCAMPWYPGPQRSTHC